MPFADAHNFLYAACIDSVDSIAYATFMGSTLTIRNLDESVKQKLRVQAARHGRSMEAEVREILARDVLGNAATGAEASADGEALASVSGRFDHLIGMWKGRMSTDEVMKVTRGE